MSVDSFLEAVRPKTGTPPAIDDVGTVIENKRRRMVVYALDEAEQEKLTIGNLAETIAASELEKEARLLDSDERKRVYVVLYQNHLPKLDSAGIIDYDEDRGTLERGPSFDPMCRILEAVAETQKDPEPGVLATWASKIVPEIVAATQSPLTIEEIGVVVENERRRLLIDVIGRATDEISISELAKNVASGEYETPAAQLTKEQNKRVWISCHQTHLPRLASMDVIKYDPDADESQVRRGPAFDHAQRVIKAVRNECDSNRGGSA